MVKFTELNEVFMIYFWNFFHYCTYKGAKQNLNNIATKYYYIPFTTWRYAVVYKATNTDTSGLLTDSY